MRRSQNLFSPRSEPSLCHLLWHPPAAHLRWEAHLGSYFSLSVFCFKYLQLVKDPAIKIFWGQQGVGFCRFDTSYCESSGAFYGLGF